jgi:hypothetical protein
MMIVKSQEQQRQRTEEAGYVERTTQHPGTLEEQREHLLEVRVCV